jgi:hypothetical protein
MVLATKQIHTPMHRIEDPEINPHSYSHLIFKKNVKKLMLEKRQPLQQIMLGKLDIHMQIETRVLALTLHKNQIKVNQKP